MKKYLIILILSLRFFGISQNDSLMPNHHADYYCNYNDDYGGYNFTFNFINTNPSEDTLLMFDSFYNDYMGFMRLDGDKVYFTADSIYFHNSIIMQISVNDSAVMYAMNNEILLYDYAVEVGDTISIFFGDTNQNGMGSHIFVSAIDTIIINGIARKRIFSQYYTGGIEDCWIKGIGSIFNPLTQYFYRRMVPFESGNSVQCVNGAYQDNSSTSFIHYSVFPNGCTAQLEEKLQFEFLLSPNPLVGEKFTIQTKFDLQKENISIFDEMGRQMDRFDWLDMGNNSFEINVPTIQAGVYYVQINSEQGKTTEKLIVLK